MNKDSFLATLDDFVEITNEIVEKLKVELDWINGHRTRCNVAKTVGTAATVGGGAVVLGSLLLAPFTGGASIVAATGYGFLAGTAGAAVNLTTDVTDMVTTHIENNQVESICGRRNAVADRLMKHFDELERVANELKKLNVDETEAYALSFKNLALKGNSIRTSAVNILQLSRCAQMASGTSNMLLRGGGTFWKGMRLQSETLIKVLGYFGFNVGKTGAMVVVRSGTAILSGAFAIYDVYSLIQSIKNNHPTADAISEMIKKMGEELNKIIELRKCAIEIGDDINMKTASFKCIHCSGALVWRYRNYQQGAVVTCAYDSCKKTFNELTCPHCSQSMFWKNADYKEGNVVTCPNQNCKKKFNHLTCVHCSGALFWKNADYGKGATVTCPYNNCKKSFTQVE